ncbi:MAG TPA: ATP-binding protein [Vicinamibacterales bacterium]|nr:ATP-binding protein [Vicinamibacterales bacterium]
MRSAWSLSNRIFLACTILATLSLGFAFAYVNATATAEAEEDLRRGLTDAAVLVEQHRDTTLTDTFTRLAHLVADLPRLKATVETGDEPTVQPIVEDYRALMNADLLVILSPTGVVLGSAGAPGAPVEEIGIPVKPTDEQILFLPSARGLLQVISVPIQVGVRPADFLGRLAVGFFLDHDRAKQFARVTGSEIAFGAEGRILASSLPAKWHGLLAPLLSANRPTSVTLEGIEYLGHAQPMVKGSERMAISRDRRPVVLVLRSRTERLRFLSTLRTGLAGALLVALLLATVASYVVARTITRPLAAVTGAMADVAATGDLTRRVSVRSRPWDDEDARLLAAAFNTLTESIARFRQAESQKERLSSLGRLSTVIAHEIRNPLMIIRASLRTLRRDTVSQAELREAVSDIDEETARLNRIVTEVLDFAKPMRFDLAEANVNDICLASAAAACAGDADVDLRLDLDPRLPPIVTDAERLRTAFVNILTNAHYAVKAASEVDGRGGVGVGVVTAAGVVVRTTEDDGRIVIAIKDRGIGISAEDMAHIFDPYFTTRRAGTGLGLPIAKNIIDGLGGTISVSSQPGEGTEIEISLPRGRDGMTA